MTSSLIAPAVARLVSRSAAGLRRKHLHRYLAEFDFRYSNRSGLGIEDAERSEIALKGITGKRLTYRRPH
jgi:hypothetical protein